jgi:hypothetical protein
MDKKSKNLVEVDPYSDDQADEIVRRLRAPPKPKTLSAIWTVEQVVDLKPLYGIDLEKEIMEALTASIAAEIDNEILNSYGQRKN